MNSKKFESHILDYRMSRELDEFSQQEWGFSGKYLMGLAGMGIKNKYQELIDEKENVHILCGKGNNGGDGYTLAYYLSLDGKIPIVWELSEPKTEASVFYRNAYLKSGGKIQNLTEFPMENLNDSIVFDCLLGTGASPGLSEEYQNLENIFKNSKAKFENVTLIAIDHPTFMVDLYDSLAEVGCYKTENTKFSFSDKTLIKIGFPINQFLETKNTTKDYYFLKPGNRKDSVRSYFEKKEDFHKYKSGSAIFIGGEKGMEGALYLSLSAFMGCGGGIAKSFFLSSEAKSLFLESNPHLMIDHWSEESKLDPFWNKTDTVVFGPGTDSSKNYKSIMNFLAEWASKKPSRRIVLDAGAIQPIVTFTDQWILTPHLGEYKRLAPQKQEINIDNILKNGKVSAQVLSCNILIKSSKQFFFHPSGDAWIWDYPNSKLATMGTGDLLTGIIACSLNRNSNSKDAIFNSLCFLDLCRGMDLTSPTAGEILEYLKVQ